MLNDIAFGLLSTLAFAAVGIALLALGYVVIDLLTPGKLGDLVYVERNANAAVVVATGLLAIGTIVTTAILTTHDDFLRGLLSTTAFGLLGIGLLAVSFVVVDLLTPGKLGDTLMSAERQPAVWITAAAHLAVGAIVAASIS